MASEPYLTQFSHIHYIRKTLTAAADVGSGATNTARVIGEVPAGSIILKSLSGVQTTTVFNGDTNAIDIGSSENDDLYATDISVASTLFVALDESVQTYVSENTVITATIAPSATTATAGSVEVVIAYMPNKQSPAS